MEKISGEVGGTLWMQLYMWADRRLSHQLVRRASAAGFEALLVTVDGAVAGNPTRAQNPARFRDGRRSNQWSKHCAPVTMTRLIES